MSYPYGHWQDMWLRPDRWGRPPGDDSKYTLYVKADEFRGEGKCLQPLPTDLRGAQKWLRQCPKGTPSQNSSTATGVPASLWTSAVGHTMMPGYQWGSQSRSGFGQHFKLQRQDRDLDEIEIGNSNSDWSRKFTEKVCGIFACMSIIWTKILS